MICTSCQKELNEEARFCDGCGDKVSVTPAPSDLCREINAPLTSDPPILDDSKTNCPKCGRIVSRQSTKCAPCGAKLKPTIKPTFESLKDDLNNIRLEAVKKNQDKGVSSATKDKQAKVIAAVLVIGIILFLFSLSQPFGPPVEVIGNAGIMRYTVTSVDNVRYVGNQVGEDVYKIAHAHRDLKKLTVNCFMSKVGITDNYGNPWKEDRQMGSINVSDLDEVRKYQSSDAYVYGNFGAGAVNQMAVSGMRYVNLISK